MELSRCSDLCRIWARNGKGHFFPQSLVFCSHPQRYPVLPRCRLSGFPSLSLRPKHNLRHCWVICCVQNLQTRWQCFAIHSESARIAPSRSFPREPTTERKALLFAFTAIIFNVQSPTSALHLYKTWNCSLKGKQLNFSINYLAFLFCAFSCSVSVKTFLLLMA